MLYLELSSILMRYHITVFITILKIIACIL